MSNPNNKSLFLSKIYLSLIIMTILLGITYFLLVDTIPPDSETVGTLFGICVRMNMHIEKNGHPPDTLKELPVREGYDNSIVDGWHREILYTFDRNTKQITLTSYGRDGKKGGQGKDRDYLFAATLNDRGLIPDAAMDNIMPDHD